MKKQPKGDNYINLIGTVNEDMLEHFITSARDILHRGYKEVKILIHSGGGDALVGLAIAEYIRVSKEQGKIKYVIAALGDCSSAATIILVSGTKRIMTKESWVMVHEDSGEISGTVTEMETETKQKRRLENQWNKIFEEHTRRDDYEWEDINSKNTYLSADECLEYGIVDVVI